MKKKNPLAIFLINLLTLGFYGLYWVIGSMEDLNKLAKKTLFNVNFTKKMLMSTLGAYLATFWGIGYKVYETIDDPSSFASRFFMALLIFCIMMILWLIGMVTLHIKLATGIKEIQGELGVEKKLSPILAGIMVIMLGATIPYMQSYINELISHKKNAIKLKYYFKNE